VFDDESRQISALSERQCRELLQSSNLARVAWQTAEGPQILPVTYVCYGDSLLFRTSPYGPLSELIQPTDVALEVDELDQQRRSGWSVVVQGRAAAVAEAAEIVHLWDVAGLVPWAPGVRNVFIQITTRRISGRLLSHNPDSDQSRESSERR
jgi:nitroimidazol reductase NimA-like FMN-containing flavoprotein (pyridoxamine 5'-phosphate oxidase superfamily)